MKYIDAEKLKANIKGLQCEQGFDTGEAERAYQCAIKDILAFIDTLQQEQPDNEDIDKVAQELYEHLYELKRHNNVPTNLYDKQEIIALWKAGIEYAYNHPKQEQPEVDLEKEIKRFLSNATKMNKGEWRGKYPISDIGFRAVARHFYELGLNARKEEKI